MTTYKVGADGLVKNDTSEDTHSLLVKIWDLGPAEVEVPEKPELPKGKEGSAEFDLAMIDFRSALADYETALKAYGQARKDFAAWHDTYGGPYQVEMYSVNAREAIQIEPTRYMVELPKGRKAGKFHLSEQQRLKDERASFANMIKRDPVFGSQGAVP